MRQLVYQVCYARYNVSFYLWLIGSVLKHCKFPKYYEQDCRTKASNRLFRDKAFSINKNPKYDGYQLELVPVADNFLKVSEQKLILM